MAPPPFMKSMQSTVCVLAPAQSALTPKILRQSLVAGETEASLDLAHRQADHWRADAAEAYARREIACTASGGIGYTAF
jgi:hypothetical protein